MQRRDTGTRRRRLMVLTMAASAATTLAIPRISRATLLYWDSNGATVGAGATPTGNWGTSNFWSTSSAGTASLK